MENNLNIIKFPTTPTKNSDSEPEPVKETIARLKAQLMQPIQATDVPRATELLKALNLPEIAVNSLTQFRLASLQAAVNQNCDDCNGVVPNCKRFVVSYTNGELVFTNEPCAKSIAYNSAKTSEKLIKRAHIPYIFSKLRAADFLKNGRGDRNQQALIAAEDAIFSDKNLFVYGGSGTGKTMLAAIIAIERAHEGKPSLFTNVPDVLDDLRDFNQYSKYTDSMTPQDKLNRIYETKCLILDDLGAEKASDWTCETLFKIINRRYNDGKQLVITSNFDIDQLQRRMNYTAGDRIIRRICDMCEPVEIV